MIETPLTLDGPNGGIPVLALEPPAPTGDAVLLWHGLTSSKEMKRPEAALLAREGLTVYTVDAPHHGARRDGWLEELARIADEHGPVAAHPMFIEVVARAVREAPALVDAALARGARRVGIAGTSMGGFIALGALVHEPRLAAGASVIGSPAWWDEDLPIPGALAAHAALEPASHVERFAPRPLLVVVAGDDETVPPDASRRFVDRLRPLYENAPDDLRFVELEGCGHELPETTWIAVWRDVAGTMASWLRR